MLPTWLAPLKSAIQYLRGASRYWLIVTKFVKRVSTIPGLVEKQQIENMDAYLRSLSKHMSELKRRGATDEELRFLAIQLSVPLIQANLEAMIVARRLSGHCDDLNPRSNAPFTAPAELDGKSQAAVEGDSQISTDLNRTTEDVKKTSPLPSSPRGKTGHDASAEIPGT
jgi:hypothetical protein